MIEGLEAGLLRAVRSLRGEDGDVTLSVQGDDVLIVARRLSGEYVSPYCEAHQGMGLRIKEALLQPAR